jgi:hypothetical protein
MTSNVFQKAAEIHEHYTTTPQLAKLAPRVKNAVSCYEDGILNLNEISKILALFEQYGEGFITLDELDALLSKF